MKFTFFNSGVQDDRHEIAIALLFCTKMPAFFRNHCESMKEPV